MLLHLASPATGACLAVCDHTCASEAARLLTLEVRAVTDGRPAPERYCRRCVSCGGIIDEPIRQSCLWHLAGCPTWEYTHTLAGSLVAHQLVSEEQMSLHDTTLVLLEAALEASCHHDDRPHPARAYALLRRWQLPPRPADRVRRRRRWSTASTSEAAKTSPLPVSQGIPETDDAERGCIWQMGRLICESP